MSASNVNHNTPTETLLNTSMDESSFEESPPTNNESFDSISHLDISPPEKKESERISAQSQVLMNSDLVEFILSFMRSFEYAMKQPESTHVLWASLACKSFFEPGMNVLWRSMNSWSPMVHLIPTVEKDEWDSSHRTKEVLRREHLQRLVEYSSRIRYFQFDTSTQPVAPQIYTSIGKYSPFELFPTLSRLEILSLDEINMANISSLSLVLPPTLSDVTISSITPRVEILAATLLDDISEKGRNLLKLSLEGKPSLLCFNTIRVLNSLQTLHINSKDSILPENFVKIISQLDSLKSLRISLEGSSTWSPPEDTSTVGFPDGFSSLRNLHIAGSSGSVLALIGHITSLPKLETINVHFSSTTNIDQESGRFVELLVSLTGPDLLAICVTSTNMASPVTVGGLQNLSSTRLQVLQLETVRLSPGSIRTLSSSGFLGALQKIRIVATKGVWRNGGTRLHVETANLILMHLFFNLQSLEISINLDFTEAKIKSMEQATKIKRQCHNLHELILVPYQSHTSPTGDFNVKNAFIFARYINHLFPHLKKLDLSKFTTVDDSWRQGVEVMVIGLQDLQICDCH